MTFVIRNKAKVEPFLKEKNVVYSELVQDLKIRRKKFHSINELKKIWTDPIYGYVMRAISEYYLKKCSLKHIFNSRISHYGIHIKYRQGLRRALNSPF